MLHVGIQTYIYYAMSLSTLLKYHCFSQVPWIFYTGASSANSDNFSHSLPRTKPLYCLFFFLLWGLGLSEDAK